MQGRKAERWRDLCEQAAVEQDPKKLVELVSEINRLLKEKQARLDADIRRGHACRKRISIDSGPERDPCSC